MTFRKMISAIATTLVLLLAVAIFALWVNPPEILRVGANYSAKIVCSNVFLAGRDPDEVLHADVQSPGVALLHLMQVTVDRQQKVVRAGLLGFIGHGLALARPTTGCAAIPDGNLEFARRVDALTAPADAAANRTTAGATNPTAPWPDGNAATPNPAIDRLLTDDALAGPGMRAIVVADHGRIVAERYAAGFSAATPLLGWYMTKSVVASVVGLLVTDGRL